LSKYAKGCDSYKGEIIAALMNYFECEMDALFVVDIEETAE
jgi:hypothetical protein